MAAEQPSALPDLVVRRNVAGAKETTFAIGGPIQTLFEVNSVAGLSALIKKFNGMGQKYLVLGAGSNLLIPDGGVALPVIKLGRGFKYLKQIGEGKFSVGGASSLMTLVRELSEEGYAGLEFAGGIPASFGGALRMNAGAHGAELSGLVSSVSCVDTAGEVLELAARELRFGYRYAELPPDAVIIAGTIDVVKGEKGRILRKRAEFLAERKSRQPLQLPSAGSVFRNPSPSQSAGWLIEQAGLKGRQIGGARISEQHANWIVNPERSASSANVLELIDLCIKAVNEKHSVILEPEIVRW